MATTIDINLDRSGGLLAGGSCPLGVLPSFTRNDEYLIRLRVLEKNDAGQYVDATLSSPTFKMGVGSLSTYPTSGEFKLVIGTTTSSAISYNATTTQVLNAISGIAGQATVETYGSSNSAWLITAATNNTALSFSGVTYTLFPTSSILVNTRRFPGTDYKAQQVIQLSRNPAVFTDTFSSTTGNGISMSKLQDGSSTQNEVYELSVGSDIIGGSFSLSFGGYSISSSIGTSADNITTQLSAITGIGLGNIAVQSNSKNGYVFTFVNQLGLQNITTALILDGSGIINPTFYQTTLTMGTVQLDELFNEADANNITPTLEVELSEQGKIKTLFQGSVNINKDLITSGSVVPAPSVQYYTKTEVDNGFIANSSSNIDSANRILYGASSQKSVDYGNRALTDSANTTQVQWGSTGVTLNNTIYATGNISASSVGGTKIGTTTSQKLAFFGATPVVQPTDANAISCMASLGLFKDATTTYGVFPNSSKTLTTTASLSFGTIGGNSSTSITVSVTGASINDIVLLGLPSGISAGLSFLGHVTTANEVEVDAVNATNSNKIQSTQTYRITVIGY